MPVRTDSWLGEKEGGPLNRAPLVSILAEILALPGMPYKKRKSLVDLHSTATLFILSPLIM